MEQTIPRRQFEALLHNSILEAINNILSAALTSRSENDFGLICLEIAQKLTRSRFGFIGEINDKGLTDIAICNPDWDACKVIGAKGHRMEGISFKKSGIFGRLINDNKAYFTNDPENLPDCSGLPSGHPPINSFLGVPLVRFSQVIGILAVGNRIGGYTHEEQCTLESIAPTIVESLMHKRAEESLRKSEMKFRNLVKYAPAVIYEMDVQGKKFLSINDTMCAILGYSQDELFSIPPMDLLDDASKLLFKERIKKRISEEQIEDSVEYKVRKKNGDWIHVIINVGNISYSEEVPTTVTVIAYDISEWKRMEEALRDSEKKYRELIKYAPSGIYEVDFRTKKFTSVNDSMCLLSGYSRDELLSMTPFEILDDEGKTAFQARIMKWLSGEKPDENVEYKVMAKDGHLIYALLNVKFKADDNGNPTGAMVIAHDITERRKTEEALRDSEERFRTAFESGAIPMAITATDGNLIKVNTVFCRMLGYTSTELIGHDVIEFTYPDDRAENQVKAQTLYKDGRPYHMEKRYIRKDGAVVWADVNSVAVKDTFGNPAYVITHIQDITARKKAEEDLKTNEARLIELNTTKDKFFNIVAHDLKNPFTSLIGSSEILHNNIYQMDKGTIRSLALILNDSAKSGYAILENLLAWSRSQTGVLTHTPEKLNLKILIEENLSNLQLFAYNKAISLVTDVRRTIFFTSDKAMISLVLRNLISNAIKFTPRGGKIEIKGILNSDGVKISVADNGIGIGNENINKLFALDTKHTMLGTEKEQGTGLGLKLCKEFVEKLGGKIWVESTLSGGSTFCFSIPENFRKVLPDNHNK